MVDMSSLIMSNNVPGKKTRLGIRLLSQRHKRHEGHNYFPLTMAPAKSGVDNDVQAKKLGTR